ncbi:MAG: NAD(P)H-dependent flavin oxidoreductase [Candidatus Saccharimonadaceae bacterium]
MKSLNIGGLISKLPIIQGGMGICVSLSGLASAVANEGGIGVISAVGIGMLEPNYRKKFRESNKIALTKEIRKAREKSDGVIGVNIMMAISDFDDLLKIALEENVDVVFIGAGLFLKKPEMPEGCTTKFIPKVSTARAARVIFNYWAEKYNCVPDGVVIEGPMCGGHVGFKKDELLHEQKPLHEMVQETVAVIKPFEERFGIEIPVIAAGGIYTGTDMFNIMEAGASAVKMGTRFVTTHECDVSDAFKQNYLRATPQDITLIDSPVGLPGRVISNDYVRAIQSGETMPVNCAWKCLKTCDYKKAPFCIASALFNAAQGNLDQGFSFAGSKAYLAEKIMSVKETIDQIKHEYAEAKYMAQLKLKAI